METAIGIAEGNRRSVVSLLNDILADEVTLYLKTRHFHWNVEGPRFAQLHHFFETQYEALDDIMDDTAERARALDGYATGSLKRISERTRLKDAPEGALTDREMLQILLHDHETLARQLRGDVEATGSRYGDVGTQDFLTGLLEAHEKMAWMLRAHLRGA